MPQILIPINAVFSILVCWANFNCSIGFYKYSRSILSFLHISWFILSICPDIDISPVQEVEGGHKMEFRASAEGHQSAFVGLDRARRCVDPFLNAAFAVSNLATLEGKLRYVPIVMPENMRQRYPARSKLRRKERLYDCAPQLNYEVFVSGSFEDQLREYIRGIAESAPHLAELGASPEQIAEFETILEGAVDRIVTERPDQIRH